VLAIDTNVVVRYFVDDDRTQFLAARRLIESSAIFLSITVMLELEWVLRGGYDYRPHEFVTAFRAFAGLRTVTLENPGLAATALGWHERGMDFADALHLAGAAACEAFVTFDRRLANAAAKTDAIPVRAP
jgi:predicted nucleic-acid-binding protein